MHSPCSNTSAIVRCSRVKLSTRPNENHPTLFLRIALLTCIILQHHPHNEIFLCLLVSPWIPPNHQQTLLPPITRLCRNSSLVRLLPALLLPVSERVLLPRVLLQLLARQREWQPLLHRMRICIRHLLIIFLFL